MKLIGKIFILSIGILLLASCQIKAQTTYYLDAENGSDSNKGTSK